MKQNEALRIFHICKDKFERNEWSPLDGSKTDFYIDLSLYGEDSTLVCVDSNGFADINFDDSSLCLSEDEKCAIVSACQTILTSEFYAHLIKTNGGIYYCKHTDLKSLIKFALVNAVWHKDKDGDPETTIVINNKEFTICKFCKTYTVSWDNFDDYPIVNAIDDVLAEMEV